LKVSTSGSPKSSSTPSPHLGSRWAAARQALNAAGLTVDLIHSDSWFRAFRVTDPAAEQSVAVDLGYDYRKEQPVVIANIGPVIGLGDVVVGKVRALWDRQAARDYLDIDAILATGRWTVLDLRAILTEIRPEATDATFAQILREAGDVDPKEYAEYGRSPSDLTALALHLDQHARLLDAGLLSANRRPASE